jgi:EPS-associated MarR family transcriptional regulator
MSHAITDEMRYRLLKHLAEYPEASQRELAERLGISLGKVNYCLRALVARGWVKMRNFKNSQRKSGYAYYLTPKGLDHKFQVTMRFLQLKVAEHDAVLRDIEVLQAEVAASTQAAADTGRDG